MYVFPGMPCIRRRKSSLSSPVHRLTSPCRTSQIAENYHGTTEFWWQCLRWMLAMGIIILQQSSGFGTWASGVHDSFSSIPFPIGSDVPTSEITFNDLGSTKDVLMYYVNIMNHHIASSEELFPSSSMIALDDQTQIVKMELSIVSRLKADSQCDYFNVTQDDSTMKNQLCTRYPDTEDECPVKWFCPKNQSSPMVPRPEAMEMAAVLTTGCTESNMSCVFFPPECAKSFGYVDVS